MFPNDTFESLLIFESVKCILINFHLNQVLLSDQPEYNEKLHGAYLLAPPAYMSHAFNPIFLIAQWAGDIEVLFHLFGMWEFIPHYEIISWMAHLFCDVDDHPLNSILCENIAFIIAGVNKSQLNA